MSNTEYELYARHELHQWQKKMRRHPTVLNRLTRYAQERINRIIPEKVHAAITTAIKQMVRGVLFGAIHTTRSPWRDVVSLEDRELTVRDRIAFYRTTASAEGAITGAGGFLLGLADFPLLLGLKLKMLFEVAALYGFDVQDYTERLFLLHIFQLAFSSQQGRNEVFVRLTDWESYRTTLPDDVHDFDWRTFQQEYRDYIDLAKIAQLLPVIGAVVGAVANYKLINHLGDTAMMCYRMRLEGSRGQ
jgi:EcsC protein family